MATPNPGAIVGGGFGNHDDAGAVLHVRQLHDALVAERPGVGMIQRQPGGVLADARDADVVRERQWSVSLRRGRTPEHSYLFAANVPVLVMVPGKFCIRNP